MNSPEKILIIDDEKTVLQSFADHIPDRNFEVLKAENSRIGLELVEKEHPDIVLVDLCMPEIDGLELLKRMKKLAPEIPTIVIFGTNRIGDVARALRCGAWDYLVKPVKDLFLLEHSVTKNLEKARLVKENKAYHKQLKAMVDKRAQEFKHTFEKLQESEKRYKTLFERTDAAIFIIEKATGRCLDVNAAATKLTGRPIEELTKMTFGEILPKGADERLQSFQNLNKVKELGKVTFHKPDNTARIARLSVVPLDDKAVISIARDITHYQEMEKQLRHSQKMEAIGTLAGGIAHDFNNILSGILGYAQLARMTLDDPGKTQKKLDQIIVGAQRAAGLVQQILTFSRQADHKNNPLKVFLIVKEAIKFLRASIPANIKIQDKVEAKATVLADPVQVHQVVMNLCTNAYHAMRDSGGVLMIELSEIEITPLEIPPANPCAPGRYLKLEVKDTGHGMTKKTVEKIFDPYFSTKQPDQGTGLGLAVVDGIVKKQKGFIRAYSEIHKGSIFQIFWPVMEKQEAFKSNVREKIDLIQGSGHIMIVDDEDDILEISQVILEKQGYQVSVFKDGMSALNAFNNDPGFFDLIVTDMAMPKMTGAELSVKVLDIREDIPIILCTGYSENFDKNMAHEIGIKQYVLKPVIWQDLSVHIRELLDQKLY